MPDQRPQLAADKAGAAPPFVRAKLAPPELMPATLLRPRLVERLRDALRRRLVLISAPAGYGKTTLLAAWRSLLHGEVTRAAWLTLDAADNDVRVLLPYVGAALRSLGGTPLVVEPGRQGPVGLPEPFIADMLNDLAELPCEAVIVLDDYHTITTPEIHRAVTFLVDHLPPRAHLVIVTRADPPLPLARWRARGHLAELRTGDLRLNHKEATAYLIESMGLALDREQIAALVDRTEGWPAGLQLTATALRDRADDPAYVEAALNNHRYIVDYLIEDVYARLAPHIQAFLLQTSILTRLSGPLSDAVLGIPAAGEVAVRDSYSRLILEELERENIFIIPLDAERQWYRYHHLFAEVLHNRLLANMAPERVAMLHRRASAWFVAHGLLTPAVDHALQAGAVEDVVAIIEPVGLAIVARVGEARLRAWLPAIPAATIRAQPRLALLRAWLCLADNDVAAARQWLQVAEKALDHSAAEEATSADNLANLHGELWAVRTRLATIVGEAPTVITSAAEALQRLQSDNLALRTRVLKDLGYAYMAQGDPGRAERAFAEAMVSGVTGGYPYLSFLAVSDYACVQSLRGALSAGITACRELLGHAGQQGQLDAPGAGLPYLALADLCRERREPAETLPALARATARITASNTTSYLCLMLVEARVARAQGDLKGALGTVWRARFVARQRELSWACKILDALEAQLMITLGNLEGAAGLIAHGDGGHEPAEFRFLPPAVIYVAEHYLVAPVQLRFARATGRLEALRELAADLEDQIAAVDAAGPHWLRIKLRVVQALALDGAGRTQAAMAVMRRALVLASAEGYAEVFAEEGAPVVALLRNLADDGVADEAVAYAHKLLDQLALPAGSLAQQPAVTEPAAAPAGTLPEPLSAREIDVLRLVADGRSNPEIAADLVIAVSTVKSHINNIFGKLGVATRTQAIARARRLGLL